MSRRIVSPNRNPDGETSRTARDRASARQQASDDEATAVDSNNTRFGDDNGFEHVSPATGVTRDTIAEAAYRRAQQRGFEPGHELEDWFAAERELMEREGAAVIG